MTDTDSSDEDSDNGELTVEAEAAEVWEQLGLALLTDLSTWTRPGNLALALDWFSGLLLNRLRSVESPGGVDVANLPTRWLPPQSVKDLYLQFTVFSEAEESKENCSRRCAPCLFANHWRRPDSWHSTHCPQGTTPSGPPTTRGGRRS